MTAKELVKSKLPTAKAEYHYAFSLMGKRKYWLIRERGNSMYFCAGETEQKAWVNAKKTLIEIDHQKK